jgi:KDO2-lipid IV(A) lauroyltransferase
VLEEPLKPRWTKPLEWWATRQFVRTLNLVGRATSHSAQVRLGAALAGIAYRTMTRYRKVALANLELAYGGVWTRAEIERVARESFRSLATTLVEFFLRQPRMTGDDVAREVGFEGQEHFEAAFARGKGILLITAHYGNWELMGPRLVRAGYAVSAVSRVADDPGMEQMIESIRTRCGLKQIPRQHAARQGLAALRRNEILAILLDQNTAEGGVFVPFFGQPASTATGPAVFALKTGAALLPTFCMREPDGTYCMKAWPPIYPQPSGDRGADIRRLTAAVTQVIEAQVRERPEQWCWLHNRWKLRPSETEADHASAGHGLAQKGSVECKPSD